MSIFNGAAADIENNKNKVDEITEASTNKQYPGAKATYDLVKQQVNGTIKPIELTGTELDVTASPQLENGFYKAAQNIKLVRAQGETENYYIPKDAVFSVLKSYDSEIGGDYSHFEIQLLNQCLLSEYNGQISPYSIGYNYFYARALLGTEIEYSFASKVANRYETNRELKALNQKLTQNAAESAQQFCGALKGSSCGAALRLGDVSPVQHSIRLKAGSKNLFNVANAEKYSGTASFVKSNGTITVCHKGVNAWCSANVLLSEDLIGKTITVSAMAKTSGVNRACMRVLWMNSGVALPPDSYIISKYYSGEDFTQLTCSGTVPASPKAGAKLCLLLYSNSSTDSDLSTDTTYSATFSNIQVEIGSAATEYTPYISDLSTVAVRAAGKNLIDYRLWKNSTTVSGVTVQYLANEDCFVLNGTATSAAMLASSHISPIPCKNKTFSISAIYLSGNITYPTGENKHAAFYTGSYVRASQTTNLLDTPNFTTANVSVTETLTSAEHIDCAWFYITPGVCFENYKVRIQFELGTAATDYEPYSATVYTADSNGEVAGVLSKYPVTSLIAENSGVVLTAEYNRDVNKAFAALQQAVISLGGTV